MENDPELEQVICNALSLQEDYPDLYLPTKSVGSSGTFPSDVELQLPLKNSNTLQNTLVELYSIIGFPQETPTSGTIVTVKQEESTQTTCIQDQLHCTSQNTAALNSKFHTL